MLRAEGTPQLGIQTLPDSLPLNFVSVGVLNPSSVRSRASALESEFPSA